MRNNQNLNIFSIIIKERTYLYSTNNNIIKQIFKPKFKTGNACTECIKKINEIKLEDSNRFFTENNSKINNAIFQNSDSDEYNQMKII